MKVQRCLPGMFSPVDLGIRRGVAAVSHADRVDAGWSARAFDLVIEFKRQHGGQPFILEQAVIYAEQHGLSKPPDRRAWGPVAKELEQAKWITRVRGQFRPDQYGSPKAVWI